MKKGSVHLRPHVATLVLLAAAGTIAYAAATERIVHAGADGHAGRAATDADVANLPRSPTNAEAGVPRSDAQDLEEGKLTTDDLVEGAHGIGDGGFVSNGSSE
jgi:hypothetical protein